MELCQGAFGLGLRKRFFTRKWSHFGHTHLHNAHRHTVGFLGVLQSQELDSMILLSPFQVSRFFNSVKAEVTESTTPGRASELSKHLGVDAESSLSMVHVLLVNVSPAVSPQS